MHKKSISCFESFREMSGIIICISLITSACSQLTKYGMYSSRNGQDSDPGQGEANRVTIIYSHDRTTPLHYAVSTSDSERVKQLCSFSCVYVNKQNSNGETPLHIAANNGHVEIVTNLLSCGNIDPNLKNQFGYTPLCLAVEYEHIEVVKLLASFQGISINEQTCLGKTALDIALESGYEEIAKLLRSYGAVSR